MIDTLRCFLDGESFYQAIITKDVFHLSLRIFFIFSLFFVFFIFKKLLEKSKENENMYKELFNNTKNGIAIYKAVENGNDFVFIDFNGGGEDIDNIDKKNVLNKKVTEIFPKIVEMGLLKIFQNVYKTGKTESFIGKYDNSWRDNRVYKLPNNNIVSIYSDITNIKQSEQEIKRREQKLIITFESIGDGVITTDTNLKITMVNNAAENILETNKNDVIGKNLTKLFDPYKDIFGDFSIKKIANKVLEYGKIITIPKLKYKCPNGKIKMLEDSMSPIQNNGKKEGLVIVFRDITYKISIEEKAKELEDQLLHSQKMNAIGQFSGGIAHDFNNILTAISGSVDIITMNEKNIPYKDEILQIRNAVTRATELTKKLLTFSRKQAINPKVVNINELIENLLNIIKRLVGENIKVCTELNSSKNIKVDIGQFEQIILNLTANSRDAINENKIKHKKISIRTFDFKTSENEFGLNFGEYVLLEIKDNGCGIDKSIRKKIFEPFFTTKKQGMGTGLGLSTVYGIVKQNKGYIRLNSMKNKGSTFKIYFPITKEKKIKDLENKITKKLNIHGKETILFVEDNKDIKNIVVKYLKSLGYRVIEADNGKEALNKKIEKIDIVITDIVMPEMGGQELVKELKRIMPNINVIFTSGYPNSKNFKFNDNLLLMKPYSLSNLAENIRKTLE